MGDEEHRHVFIHEGGGCIEGPVASESLRCDDRYACECGLHFSSKSDSLTHSMMPAIIMGKERKIDVTQAKEQLTESEINELEKGHLHYDDLMRKGIDPVTAYRATREIRKEGYGY